MLLAPALTAAVSSSLSQNIAEVVGQGGAAPLTSLQIHFIQNMIHETLEEFRSVPDFLHILPNYCSFRKVSAFKAYTAKQ